MKPCAYITADPGVYVTRCDCHGCLYGRYRVSMKGFVPQGLYDHPGIMDNLRAQAQVQATIQDQLETKPNPILNRTEIDIMFASADDLRPATMEELRGHHHHYVNGVCVACGEYRL